MNEKLAILLELFSKNGIDITDFHYSKTDDITMISIPFSSENILYINNFIKNVGGFEKVKTIYEPNVMKEGMNIVYSHYNNSKEATITIYYHEVTSDFAFDKITNSFTKSLETSGRLIQLQLLKNSFGVKSRLFDELNLNQEKEYISEKIKTYIYK